MLILTHHCLQVIAAGLALDEIKDGLSSVPTP